MLKDSWALKGLILAVKLSDPETREELGEKLDEVKEKAADGIEQGKTYGKNAFASRRSGCSPRISQKGKRALVN